jgi:2-polyprenyl-3-methyl-5-hydroxy-6-metoxy-1,4-benzoquinol methylase
MSWDPIWERIFSEYGWGRYPNEELVRFMTRNFGRSGDRSAVRVLEIGCGNGANLWYLAREGFEPFGIDGAPTAIRLAGERLAAEAVNADLRVGDVVALPAVYPPQYFDAVVDVACLQCNHLPEVQRIVAACTAVLKPGGRMFSLLVARGSWGDGCGREVAPGTFTDIGEGPLKDRGLNHFFTREEVGDLWKSYAELGVEYVARSFRGGTREYKTWVVDAVLRR